MIPETVPIPDQPVVEADPFENLVLEGQVVALFTGDELCEYYLMKVTHPLSSYTEVTKDQWGAVIPQSTEVFTELYYDTVGEKRYSLIRSPNAVVPAASILNICAQVDSRKDTTKLTKYIHISLLELVCKKNAR
ncbi:hypothetical protein DPMN_128754 [Dreissena polymorpha]|uniref:Uncharacterized protein n=1 Tax=Dreissena polymorpha TaxID=45954 RepID=A0A9D4H1V2_DREPO|nr:hypothetical protein DPMN_128754 [Dreissena polymorpha]